MYRILVFIALYCMSMVSAYAQDEGNVWAFGYGAGLDFNSGSPVAISTSISSYEGCASVCDANGQLLFYTEGSYIWDRTGALMPNGSDLTPFPSDFSSVPTVSSSQGTAIVPIPGNPHQYYVFSLTCAEMDENAGRLYYSKVDMNANGGMGDVITGQKGILLDSLLSERMNSVIGDNCYYWLMVCSQGQQDLTFKAYQISESGISSNPVLSPVGIGSADNWLPGYLVFSPNRHRMAITRAFSLSTGSCASLYDFDPLTGIVSNPINLLSKYGRGAYGICFSPDNSKLYINSVSDSIYQYDVSTTDISTILDSKKGIVSTFYSLAPIKQGPDNKLYIAGNSSYGLDVINDPNLVAPFCDWEGGVIPLSPGSAMSYGLPTNTLPPLIRDTFITVQSDTAGCFSVNPTISAGDTNGLNYQWSTGATTAAIQTTLSGTYWVRYNIPPCSYHIDTIHFTMPYGTLPQISVEAPCRQNADGKAWAATFEGDTVQYQYYWLNQNGDTLSVTDTLHNAAAGHYSVYIHTASCDTMLEVTIEAIEDTVSFTASDTFACVEDIINFQNTSEPYYTSFNWNLGDGTTGITANISHAYNQGDIYTVQLVGTGEKCSDTAYQTVTIDTPVAIGFTKDRDSICTGEMIHFTVAANNGITYQDWTFGDGAYIRNTLPQGSLDHAYDEAGAFPVTLNTHYRACPESMHTDTVNVFPMPVVNLSNDTALCLGGYPIRLENLVSNSGILHYEWSTGDTTVSIVAKDAGKYSLTVTQEPAGCANTDEVAVKKDCYIDIPNGFTPNGDGVNDYFFPRQYLSKSVTRFRMQILNRWGQKVFETTSTDGRGWDGKYNGKDQPAGVYIYIIDVLIDGTKPEHYEGNVTLLR